MDQSNNSKVDKHFIYGIFRACRLCGAGAGYKMPIIQNVIDVDGEEVELKQKIRECVHIEVRQDDKMPPLICELCVDKVNDFYEFLEMCRQTNKRTRKILGLPMPSKKGAVTSDDCILGVTEPVYVNEDSDEPLSKPTPRNVKQKPMPAKFKKVEIKLTQMENISKHHKSAKPPPKRQRSPSPPPRTSSAKQPLKRQKSPSPPPRTSSAKHTLRRQRSPSPPPRTTRTNQPMKRQRSPSPPPRTSSGKQSLRRQRSPSPPPRTSRTNQPTKRQRSPSPPPRTSRTNQSLRRQKSPSPPPRTSSAKQPLKRQRSPSPPPRTTRTNQPMKRQRSPTPPPRTTRLSRGSNEDNQSLSSLQFKRSTRLSSPVTPPPKSILKKEPKIEEKVRPGPKSKRAPEPPKPALPQKKVKLPIPPAPAPKTPPLFKCSVCKVQTKTPQAAANHMRIHTVIYTSEKLFHQPETKPPRLIKCSICKVQTQTPQAAANHMRIHTVIYTSEKLACNACREWFTNVEDALAHHKRHNARNRGYLCRGCDEHYDTYDEYQEHAGNHQCVPWEEVPDVQCPECWKYFPTNNVRDTHKCQGVDGRPGGKCAKCSRPYALQKNLKKHESTCTAKRRSDFYIDPALLSKVRPIQIRVARCDPLLQRISNGHYDVSDVQDYGLDPTRVYPYIYSASLNFNRMVNIRSDLYFYCDEDYIHWDSEISDDEDERFLEREKKVPSLTTLTLKTLFSQKYLGRVPRKKRKMKSEKSLFDVIMSTDFDIDMTRDINNIIDNLGDDESVDESAEKDINISNESFKNEESTSDTDFSQDKEDSSVATKNKESVNEKNDKVSREETEKSSVNPEIEPKIANDVEDSNKNKKSEETTKNDGNVKKAEEKTTDMKENTGESVRENEKKESTDSKVDEESNKRDTEQVNDASELSANTDSVSESLENKKDTNLSENLNQAEVDINNKDINENNDNAETDSNKIKDEISKDAKNEQNNTNLDLVDTDKEQSNTENHNEGTMNTNSNDDSKNTENKTNDDNVQQINSQLNEIEKSETNVHKTDDITTNAANIHKENNKTEASTGDKTPIDANDTDKNINGVDEKTDKLNMEDFKEVCDSEIDDAKLMKDLNEHIGETDEKTSKPTDSSDAEGSDVLKDKNKDLVAKKDSDARSMDLDSISDEEFNFDN